MNKIIFLRISEVAAFLGQNKYSIIEPFERLIKSIDPTIFQISVKSLKSSIIQKEIELQTLYFQRDLVTEDYQQKKLSLDKFRAKIQELDEKEITVTELIAIATAKIDDITLNTQERIAKVLGVSAVENITSSKIETAEKRNVTVKLIGELKNLTMAKRIKILKDADNLISTTHGILKENAAIKMFEALYNVKLDTSQRLYRVQYENPLFKSEVVIGGRLDGVHLNLIDPSKSFIVEVKNRTKRFFDELRDYEKTQIQLYCWVMNIKSARLVEKFGNEIRVTEIDYDEQYIFSLFSAIDLFISRIENNFLADPETVQNYFQLEEIEKLKFLKGLYLDEISQLFP